MRTLEHANLAKYMKNCFMGVKDVKCTGFFSMVEALNFEALNGRNYPGNRGQLTEYWT